MQQKHKKKRQPKLPFLKIQLLFDDLQDFHGASLDTDAAGDALGSGATLGHNHDLHGANLHALAAGDALLLVDHVNAGLGVLGDGLVFTDLHALAALDADIGLGGAVLAGDDLDAGLGDVIDLIERFGAGLNTLQAGHAFGTLLDSQLFHNGYLL